MDFDGFEFLRGHQFLVDFFYKEKRLDSLTIMETVKLDD
jgi:hypothetical protein